MAALLKSIRIRNYRSLADVSLELKPINVLFGPSGAGKSSLLEAIRFVRDDVEQGVEAASARQGQGVGLLFDRAAPAERMRIKLVTEAAKYEVSVGFSEGRIDPLAGEAWTGPAERRDDTTRELIEILSTTRLYQSRSLALAKLKHLGSAAGADSPLSEQGENLWSILRELEGYRQGDERYATILRYMSEAFPTFKGLVIEATSPNGLHASFLEHRRTAPVSASGIPDGHLQFLILLTALFGEVPKKPRLVLFDEPEAALHPWSLAVLGKAIFEATHSWGRQVIMATHSPALISQFDLDEQLAVEMRDGRTIITRANAIEDLRDLLDDYATGSLYMSEAIAPQSGFIDIPAPRP